MITVIIMRELNRLSHETDYFAQSLYYSLMYDTVSYYCIYEQFKTAVPKRSNIKAQ